MLSQKSVFSVELQGKRFEFYCDNDSPLGCVHDALMQMKGWTVERMCANQKQEDEMAKKLTSEELPNEG